MARTVNEQDYEVKRTEILAVARRLVYTKGYEQMTIRDMLDELQISKGAFYHYFDSKQALLEALIERMQQEGEQIFITIMQDESLPALVKLQRFFDSAGRWKTAQKDYILALLQVWYTDDNAIVRQKVQMTMMQHITPLLAQVIHQGLAEGVVNSAFPDQAAAIVLTLLMGAGDAMAHLLLTFEPGSDAMQRAVHITVAYNDALERVLGAPADSLHLIDAATIQEWFVAARGQRGV